MPIDKTHIRKGAFLTGGSYPTTQVAGRTPVPADLAEFQSAADLADQLGSSRAYLEMEKWAREAHETIESLRKKVPR